MDWENLKKAKCPKCRGQLARNLMYKTYDCTKCTFKINDLKFNEIVNNLYKKKNYDNFRDDNSHELNNLGPDEVNETQYE